MFLYGTVRIFDNQLSKQFVVEYSFPDGFCWQCGLAVNPVLNMSNMSVRVRLKIIIYFFFSSHSIYFSLVGVGH